MVSSKNSNFVNNDVAKFKQLNFTGAYRASQVNIDKIKNVYGYMMQIYVDDASTALGTQPTSIVNSNTYLLLGFSNADAANNKLYYGVQIAIGFGASKIAIRNCQYNASGAGTWSTWAAV